MTIQIYTTKSCHYCNKAKDYFKANDIEFESFDIGENQEKKQELLDAGFLSVPIIKVNNKTLVGWDKDKFESLMKTTNS